MGTDKVTLIYLDNKMLLSKKIYTGWKECQFDYSEHYKTNMVPMRVEDLCDFFAQDYGDDDTEWPFAKKDIYDFYQNDECILISK